jgi:MurNAc alpha-1-phosphate uridylyltransferase
MKLNGFILAAGYGKRMGEYTKKIPKPLLPINNIPLIYYSLYNFYRWKINKIYINVHYFSDIIVESLKNYPHAELIFSNEENILGTAGGIRTAIENNLNQHLVILNPDTILLPEIADNPQKNKFTESLDSLLYVSIKNQESKETGFELSSSGNYGDLNFSDSGKFYYIGYSIIYGKILKDAPPFTKLELGEIWKNSGYNLHGKIFKGRFFDCGNSTNYEALKDMKVYSENDYDWSRFIESSKI